MSASRPQIKMPRQRPFPDVVTERRGVLEVENASLRRTVEAQRQQMADMKQRLNDSLIRARRLERRVAELSEKHALAAGAPRAAPPLTTLKGEPA